MQLLSINPHTGHHIRAFSIWSAVRLQDELAETDAFFKAFSAWSLAKRAQKFHVLSALLLEYRDSLATLMVEEMGKPITQARAEIEKCSWVCRYFAEEGERFLADEHIRTEARKSYVSYQPLGTILAIMPWNFPFWQVFRCAVPAMMAGNTMLLKHAENTTGCALELERLFQEAGFDAAFKTLLVSRERVPELLADKRIVGVSLTGSTRAGKTVAELAGKHLKKAVLELGGADPYIILEDADLDVAAEKCVMGRMLNNGQSCIAAKRWIVVESVYDTFLTKVKHLMQRYEMNNPLLEDTRLGPLARMDLRDELHRQVRESRKLGASVVVGGELPSRPGWYYPPTILATIPKTAPAFKEELFGPVASLFAAKDEQAAIHLANDSDYGLGAALFSKDVERAEYLAKTQLQAGSCCVNDFVRSDPRLPFGGIKHSGMGRELARHGMLEFVNTKTVYVG